jgi:class 3 adenylate cyclase
VAPEPGVLAAAAAGPVAERRVCSVLFCDVAGFTPLSEARDPEAVRELLSEYFSVARTVIGRYGGVVEDAQYADARLLDFLDHLIDWVRDQRNRWNRW